jgi:hypothetical protein
MKWLGILAALVVGVAAYIWVQPGYTNRFRITVEVETPEGLKAGSSVIETTLFESGGLPEARGVRASAKGEAIFVDLGHNRNLVAILGWGELGEDEDKIFGLARATIASSSVGWKNDYKLKGRGVLPPWYFPTLISFEHLSNPATARVVDPTNLAETYGPGYSLRRMLLETTSDPVTRVIESKLPWWSSPGRPAAIAWRAWRKGQNAGVSQEPEHLFRRN